MPAIALFYQELLMNIRGIQFSGGAIEETAGSEVVHHAGAHCRLIKEILELAANG